MSDFRFIQIKKSIIISMYDISCHFWKKNRTFQYSLHHSTKLTRNIHRALWRFRALTRGVVGKIRIWKTSDRAWSWMTTHFEAVSSGRGATTENKGFLGLRPWGDRPSQMLLPPPNAAMPPTADTINGWIIWMIQRWYLRIFCLGIVAQPRPE